MQPLRRLWEVALRELQRHGQKMRHEVNTYPRAALASSLLFPARRFSRDSALRLGDAPDDFILAPPLGEARS